MFARITKKKHSPASFPYTAVSAAPAGPPRFIYPTASPLPYVSRAVTCAAVELPKESLICGVPIRLINQIIIDLWIKGWQPGWYSFESINSYKPHGKLVEGAIRLLAITEMGRHGREISDTTLYPSADLTKPIETKHFAEKELQKMKEHRFEICNKPESLRALIKALGKSVILKKMSEEAVEERKKLIEGSTPLHLWMSPSLTDELDIKIRQIQIDLDHEPNPLEYVLEAKLEEAREECIRFGIKQRQLERTIQQCDQLIQHAAFDATKDRRMAAMPW